MMETSAYFQEAVKAMEELYGKDVPMSLATVDGDRPGIRVVDVYFTGGAFYAVTYLESSKMREILKNPNVALNHLLFVVRGAAENIGHPLAVGNEALRQQLMRAFEAFYSRHVDENDPNTCILKITPEWALVFANGFKYIADFKAGTASRQDFIVDIVVQ
jgi:general stress protein 26